MRSTHHPRSAALLAISILSLQCATAGEDSGDGEPPPGGSPDAGGLGRIDAGDCLNPCDAGATRCDGTGTRFSRCLEGVNRCGEWSESTVCVAGQVCREPAGVASCVDEQAAEGEGEDPGEGEGEGEGDPDCIEVDKPECAGWHNDDECDLGVGCICDFDDCEGVQCVDGDEDGFGEDCADGPDCNDEDGAINPGAEDLCGDGIDQDCSDAPDDPPGGCGQCDPGERAPCESNGCAGERQCTGDRLWGRCEVDAQAEVCDGNDNDCDGRVDEDPLGGSPACGCGEPLCANGRWRCPLDESPPACDCGDPACNGGVWRCPLDAELNAPCRTALPGICRDGLKDCADGALYCEPFIDPGSVEEQCNDADDDCDGEVDEGNPGGGGECDTGLDGVCGGGSEVCDDGRLVCGVVVEPGSREEACGNEVDEDCDGEVDESPPCSACERDADELIQPGCDSNDSPVCSGQGEVWANDCDALRGDTVLVGTLSHEDDEDWYDARIREQNLLCTLEVDVTLDDVPDGEDYELCAYWANADGTHPDVECESDTDFPSVLMASNWQRFQGANGCCSTRGGRGDSERVRLDGDFNLGEANELGYALIRVYPFLQSNSCNSYTLTYHF